MFTGPLTGVKEQVTGNYARRLAERGYVTLAFDHRNFGDSEGVPRQQEDAAGKLADLRAAVSDLATLPQVDPSRIGVCGVCLGTAHAPTRAPRRCVLKPAHPRDRAHRHEHLRG